MEVRNCKQCGRLFNYLNGRPICPACKQELEDKFSQVKAYIREHGGATINEVAEENDVDIGQIKQWVREERLEFAEDSLSGVACEVCGATIKSGRYCDKCKAELATGLRNSITPTKKVENSAPSGSSRPRDRMRFL